jgi:hypothetical protein
VFFVDNAAKDVPGLHAFLAGFSKHGVGGENDMLVIAGLPHAIDDLLKDEALSFLKRSYRASLGNIRVDEVLLFFMEAFPTGKADGNNMASVALERAAEATMGYPYLIQLIGYYLSKEEDIDDKAADRAIFRAKIELYKNIHEPLVWGLSSKDRMFLLAMAQDEGASEFGEIAKRMDVSAGYASKYRERLIDAGVIYSSAYGELAFALPFMKEYVEKEYVERFGGEGGKRRL